MPPFYTTCFRIYNDGFELFRAEELLNIKTYLEDKINAEDLSAPVGSSNNPSDKIWTLANVVTMARIALTILFLVLFVNNANRILCLVIYAVAAVTDFLDGQIARRTQTVSWFGKLLDPAVDRILLFTGVLGLCIRGELPVWIPVVIIGRDVWLALGATRLTHYRRRPVDVLFIGKVATALLLTGFSWLLLGSPVVDGFGWTHVSWLPLFNDDPACVGMLVVYAGVICSVITGLLYTLEGVQIKDASLHSEHSED
jgi:cardiolipin synthase